MDASLWFQSSYTIRRVVAFGVAGSSSVILPFVLLLFLDSQVSPHPGSFDQPIDEMMAYTEFFVFVTASYFSASVSALKFREHFQKYFASWLTIAVVGSITFSVLVVSRLMLSSARTEVTGELSALPGFIVAVLFLSVVCVIPASISCGLASALIGARERRDPLLPFLTRKY